MRDPGNEAGHDLCCWSNGNIRFLVTLIGGVTCTQMFLFSYFFVGFRGRLTSYKKLRANSGSTRIHESCLLSHLLSIIVAPNL